MQALFCFLVFAVLLVSAIALALSLVGRRHRHLVRVRREAMRRKITQIARDFPDEVRAWGGAEALEDPRNIRAIIAKLESIPNR